jgi:hypothetical protein
MKLAIDLARRVRRLERAVWMLIKHPEEPARGAQEARKIMRGSLSTNDDEGLE